MRAQNFNSLPLNISKWGFSSFSFAFFRHLEKHIATKDCVFDFLLGGFR